MSLIFRSSLIFWLVSPALAFSATDFPICEKAGQIRYILNRAEKTEPASFCTNAQKTNLISLDCQTKNCVATLPKMKVKFEELASPLGKPGFHLCRKLGGRGQLLEFRVSGKWFKLDRCIFADGRWFIDSGTLLDEYLRPKK